MATTFIRSTSPTGVVTKTTDVNGVRTIVTSTETDEARKADIVSAVAYRTYQVQNPRTGVTTTVTTSGNQVQDAAVIAAAFAASGTLTPTIISKT